MGETETHGEYGGAKTELFVQLLKRTELRRFANTVVEHFDTTFGVISQVFCAADAMPDTLKMEHLSLLFERSRLTDDLLIDLCRACEEVGGKLADNAEDTMA